MKVIAIVSGSRCGKDKTAKIFKWYYEKLNKKVTIISLAYPLKKMVANELNINIETLDKYKNNKVKITIDNEELETREYIKKYARGMESKYGKDYFINILLDTVHVLKDDIIIIPDLRFPIEYDKLYNSDLDVKYIRLDSNLEDCINDNEVINDIEYDAVLINKLNDISVLETNIKDTMNKL